MGIFIVAMYQVYIMSPAGGFDRDATQNIHLIQIQTFNKRKKNFLIQ